MFSLISILWMVCCFWHASCLWPVRFHSCLSYHLELSVSSCLQLLYWVCLFAVNWKLVFSILFMIHDVFCYPTSLCALLKCCKGLYQVLFYCSVVNYLWAQLVICLCIWIMFLKWMHDALPVVGFSCRRITAVVQRHAHAAAVRARWATHQNRPRRTLRIFQRHQLVSHLTESHML